MINSLLIANQSQIVIQKHWKAQLSQSYILELLQSPITHTPAKVGDHYVCRIPHDRLQVRNPLTQLIGVVSAEVPPLGLYYLLQSILNLLTDYLGPVTENSLKNHFDVVYQVYKMSSPQLLEEFVDHGQPHITEPSVLKQLVPPPSLLASVMNAVSISQQNSGPKTSVGTCPWRRPGIKYAHNGKFAN